MAKQGSGLLWMVAGAVGLVVGLGLGGLAPRAQIRSLQDQVEALEDNADCEPRGIGRELASAFQGRPMAAALEKDEVDAIDRARDEPEPEEEAKDGVHFEIDLGDDEGGPQNLEEGLQVAKDAMAMRKAQARAALDDQARPSEEQWDEIDGAIDQMNTDLQALANEFVGTIQDGREPSRREAMIFAADTLDVLLDADDAIWGTLSEDQRAGVDQEAIDPMSHVDPALLNTFMELDR